MPADIDDPSLLAGPYPVSDPPLLVVVVAGTRCYSSLHSPVAEQQLASAWAWLDILYRVSSKTVYTLILLFSWVPDHIQKNF